MERSEIKQKVIEIAAVQMGIRETGISDNTRFISDLKMDSLDLVEFVMELEAEFDLAIPDEAAEKLHTVYETVDYLYKTEAISKCLI